MRGAVTLVVHGRVYPSRDRPFHQSAWVGGGSAAPAFTAGRATRPDRRPLCAGTAALGSLPLLETTVQWSARPRHAPPSRWRCGTDRSDRRRRNTRVHWPVPDLLSPPPGSLGGFGQAPASRGTRDRRGPGASQEIANPARRKVALAAHNETLAIGPEALVGAREEVCARGPARSRSLLLCVGASFRTSRSGECAVVLLLLVRSAVSDGRRWLPLAKAVRAPRKLGSSPGVRLTSG